VGPTSETGANWYDLLGVPADASDEQLTAAAEKLSRQAAALATTAPERSQRLRDTVRTIRADLLSGPAARAQYDARLATAPRGVPEVRAPSSPPPPTPFPMASSPIDTPPVPGPQRLLDSVINGIGPASSRFRRFLQSGWTCPSCGNDGGPADKFCGRCGAPMKNPVHVTPARSTCPGCAAVLAPGDRFCSRCGVSAG
jgi:hypothetical protein